MKISIFGLGYVGSVSLACLSKNNHTVMGVDLHAEKVDFINQGKSPIIEKGLGELIAEQRQAGRVSATDNLEEAVANTDISFICVGTPSTSQGHLNLDAIFGVAQKIGAALKNKSTFHVIAIRSTVLPGTNEKITARLEEISGKKKDVDFAVVSNPEFLREGTAIEDYFNPSYTLIGTSSEKAKEVMAEVYKGVEAPIITTEIRVAEILKYVNNTFHALKITFANEVGNICKKLGIDSRQLMEIFCEDKKLNISKAYLKPGFAYGGSCLPKDLKALATIAHDQYLKSPILENIAASNSNHINIVLEKIMSYGKSKVGFLGLSFKEGTDDLRMSPIVDVLEQLLGKGFEIKIYDRHVHLSQLVGANKEFIMQKIPFISKFISEDSKEVLNPSEVIVVVNKEPEFASLLENLAPDKIIIDLVNLEFSGRSERSNYDGIAW